MISNWLVSDSVANATLAYVDTTTKRYLSSPGFVRFDEDVIYQLGDFALGDPALRARSLLSSTAGRYSYAATTTKNVDQRLRTLLRLLYGRRYDTASRNATVFKRIKFLLQGNFLPLLCAVRAPAVLFFDERPCGIDLDLSVAPLPDSGDPSTFGRNTSRIKLRTHPFASAETHEFVQRRNVLRCISAAA